MTQPTDNSGAPEPAGGLRRAALRLRHGLTACLARHPVVYLPLARLYLWCLRGRRGPSGAVSRHTEIVIEGFPRSANTFAVWAFRAAQGRPVQIAHHLHAPAQIMRGVRLGIPVLLLLRKPDEAIQSLLVRYPHLPPDLPLKQYVRFHERIRPYRHGFVTATFEQVTGDLGAVIRRVNRAFATGFREFEHTEDNARRIFSEIDEANRRYHGRGRIRRTFLSRPSEERAAWKAKAAKRLDAPDCAPLRARAAEIYEEFRSYANESADPRVASTDAAHD